MAWTLMAGVALALAGPGAASAVLPRWCSSGEGEGHDAAPTLRSDADQQSWLAERDSCSLAMPCLEGAYRARIAQFGEAHRLGPVKNPEEIAVAERPSSSQELRWELPYVLAQQAGTGDDSSLEMLGALDEMMPRPWCDSGRLNPTERTICADPDLSRLDALLELIYGRTTARDEDSVQLAWLRSERDACGVDRLCIARAYAARIGQLDNATDR